MRQIYFYCKIIFETKREKIVSISMLRIPNVRKNHLNKYLMTLLGIALK